MAPGGRRRENRENDKKKATTEATAKKIYKERPALQGVGSRQPVGFVFSKFGRFSGLPVLRRRKIVKERGQKRDRADLVNEAAPIKEPDEGRGETKSSQFITQNGVGTGTEEMTDNRKTKTMKISKKQHALKGSVNKRSVDHKYDRMDIVDKEAPLMELDKGISREPKNCQPAQEEIKKQEPQHGLQRRIGLSALLPFRRDPDGKSCYICGDNNHDEFFCPFNYVYGQHGLRACNSRCPPGKHPMVSSSHREFFRCFVHVNNMPPKFRRRHLARVCKSFGPLRMWHVPMVDDEVCRGFDSPEHAERAIDSLNGWSLGGRKLRVDWAYPCI